jgi:GNAT superfamily N-acetyltransferase
MRWFGRYAGDEPDAFFFAVDDELRVAGYLAGCIDSFGASAWPIIGDIPYFTPEFCEALKAYPSHFHINVKPGYQGHGIGQALASRFIDLCRAAGSSGVHVVTGAASRAIKFLEARSFQHLSPSSAFPVNCAVLVKSL